MDFKADSDLTIEDACLVIEELQHENQKLLNKLAEMEHENQLLKEELDHARKHGLPAGSSSSPISNDNNSHSRVSNGKYYQHPLLFFTSFSSRFFLYSSDLTFLLFASFIHSFS